MLDKFAKKESPIMGYAGFGGGVSTLLTLASGKATYIDDVFSTYLYKGTGAYPSGGSGQTINNGIDLSGEGGMVWVKTRNTGVRHGLFDTERGTGKALLPNENWAQVTDNTELTSFNSNGFSLGDNSGGYQFSNTTGYTHVSWTFRKCRGFFDVVTYTGNETAGRQIAHNLGSVPGMIIIKSLTSTENWTVWHRSLTSNQYLIQLNLQSKEIQGGNGPWNNTAPTSSVFTLGGDFNVNQNNQNYVAYIFAHNDGSFGEDSDEAVIKCGSYTGTQSEDTEINVGFEPQWILIKNISSNSTDWVVVDTMRGLPVGSDSEVLKANAGTTPSSYRVAALTPTGFKLGQPIASINGSGDTYIYMAIRRPHKPPEAGTDVFTAALNGTPGDSGATEWRPENVDMAWFAKRGGDAKNFQVADRLRGFQHTNANTDDSYNTPTLSTNNTNVEATSSNAIHQSHYNSGLVTMRAVSSGSNFLFYRFKRAPGFFDMVAYKGTGSSTGINHNLGVVPELKIIKNRDNSSGNWIVGGTAVAGENGYLYIDDNSTLNSHSNYWDGGDDSATKFSVRQGNASSDRSGDDYIAYLFASLDGISKVGTYSGTGNNIDIDCGFTNGARFVMIKRITSGWAASWWIFDTSRGIGSGNDPAIYLDTTGAEYNSDRIAALNSGFTVGTGDFEINQSGKDYIFFAIA